MQTQAPWGGNDPQASNQQVIYVQAPAFKPSPNYRHISYLILGIGIFLSITISSIGDLMYGWGGGALGRSTCSICCGSLGISCIVDAMYYSEKSNWEQETGVNASSTTVGMILDIVLAVGSFAMVLWIWASFLGWF